MRVAGWMGLVVTLAVGGCYNPAIPAGSQPCSTDHKCPEGMSCFPDQRCYPTGSNPGCNPACAGDKPVCDPSTLSCVGCLGDNDCPAGFLCVAAVKTCKPGCSRLHPGCTADVGRCDVDLGVCRGCLGDAECTDSAAPRCDKASGHCVVCVPDNDNCPADRYCSSEGGSFSCVPGCKTKSDCTGATDGGSPDGGFPPATADCCNHRCVDTATDGANCGACGSACNNGASCCASRCVDYTNDLRNCGGCGAACAVQNVNAPACVGSACDYDTCLAGFADCDQMRKNGCETHVSADPLNCGGCRMACGPFDHAVPGCNGGSCAIAACDSGFADCDGAVKDGCEIDVNNDPKNCGGCGRGCNPNVANAIPGCKVGMCVVGSCNPNNFRDCDGQYANGCEVNLLTDVKNCGGCGLACPQGQTCSTGKCVVGGPQLVGQYNCGDGPAWGGNPPTYTCQEACALKFGGQAAQYSCSTVMGMVNHQANTSIWGVVGCQIAAENFKVNNLYNCGVANCAQSAYVQDNCAPGTNYCYR